EANENITNAKNEVIASIKKMETLQEENKKLSMIIVGYQGRDLFSRIRNKPLAVPDEIIVKKP
ncbi:MAG: hypothetical protein LBM96_09355, partial [Methanobrevibacter sp.]|nr:hypothetical protein [Candidatus Methanoflexus mossambicus]